MKGRGDTKDRESTGGPGSDVEEVFLVVEDEDELERCPNFVVEVVWEPTGIGGGGAGKERRKEPGKEEVLMVEVKDGEMMKYKKVANRTKPVATTLPEEYRIVRHEPPDPLASLPELPIHPPDFTPGERYTQERYEANDIDPGKFMWPEEKKLGHHIIRINEFCLAWEETEKGSFKLTFYPAVMMPTIEHTPWNEKNLPIPPGIL